jgi:hypothetical protein
MMDERTPSPKSDTKRYAQYPGLAAMARGMSNEGVALVLAWHQVLRKGFDAYVRSAVPELTAGRGEVRMAVTEALRQWAVTMAEVQGVLTDRRPADWCCKQGMAAHPTPCPQHPAPVPGAVRDVGAGAEVWLNATEMTPAGWYVVGRLREESTP